MDPGGDVCQQNIQRRDDQRHKRKRVDRFLANVGFETVDTMKMLACEAWQHFGRLVVAVDWVELRNNFTAIVGAVVTGKGRALPISWSVETRSKAHRSQNCLEEAFLTLISTQTPGFRPKSPGSASSAVGASPSWTFPVMMKSS